MWEFGVYTAGGVMIAFLLSFSLFPAFLILLPAPKVIAFTASKNVWRELLTRCYNYIDTNKKWVIAISLVAFGLGILAFSRLEINNYLTEELPKNDPLNESYAFFEEHFSGVRTFDLAIQLKDPSQNIFDYEIIQQIDLLENYLKDEYGVSNLVSPAFLVRQANQIQEGGDYTNNSIPEKEDYLRLSSMLNRIQRLKYAESLVNKNQQEGRISGNMKDEGGNVHIRKNAALMAYAASNCPDLSLTLTGTSHLVDINSSKTTRSLLKSLAVALIVIGIIMALLYRSPRMLIIAIISNLLPLLIMSLVMYLAGIELKIVTTLIFTVAFGITVDDTIHLLGNLKIELSEGIHFRKALKHTYITTGKSVILTTIILFAGFVSLSLSDFSSTYYFGLVVSVGLLFAVIVDLTLLPALLLVFEGKGEEKED
jgi:predicted RND superfamily exporter protein